MVKTNTTVETVKQFAGNGRYIRTATRVTINGQTVEFMERLSKRAAIAQAQAILGAK
jgi:hypothetical protein